MKNIYFAYVVTTTGFRPMLDNIGEFVEGNDEAMLTYCINKLNLRDVEQTGMDEDRVMYEGFTKEHGVSVLFTLQKFYTI